MFGKVRLSLFAALLASIFGTAYATEAPKEIALGTLYASSGRFASISMPVHYGLKLWIEQKNAEGGVFVKAFNKKIPIKLVAYDDQSNTATAATLFNQLITQDKVDLLVSDSGSVLTSETCCRSIATCSGTSRVGDGMRRQSYSGVAFGA